MFIMATPIKSFLNVRIRSPIVLSPVRKSGIQIENKPPNIAELKPMSYLSVQDYHNTKLNNNLERTLLINSPNKLTVGKYGICGRYDILGRGAFGTVVKGTVKESLIAVKVIRGAPFEKLNERNAVGFSHENIVKILDVVMKNNTPYGMILMEYHKDSRNLQSVLEDLNFCWNREIIVKFSRDVVNGLKYCHENEVLHLDIKPNNVLLCDGRCKICDFGNSHKIEDFKGDFHHKGTVAYTGPEILKGCLPTEKSDIYAFAILLWQFIFRKPPYDLMDAEVIIYKVVKFNLRPQLKITDENKDLLELCCTCWQCNPEDRLDTTQILNVLNA